MNSASTWNLIAVRIKFLSMDSPITMPVVEDLHPHHARALTITLVLTTILYALAFVPVTMMAPLSLMGFDAPGSDKDPLVWLLVVAFLVMPVTLLIGIVAPWVALRHGRGKRAAFWAALPLLNLLLVWMIFLIG